MKKFFLKLEEIFVAATFAEEGIFETVQPNDSHSVVREPAYQQIPM